MEPINYLICDIDGEIQAIHRRIDMPGGKKQISWHLPDGSTGLNGRRLSSLPFYLSELIPTWYRSDWIFIVEGEKTAEAVLAHGHNALGTYGASAIPDPDVLATLTGWRVVLSPDNDPPGNTHMATIGDRLLGITVAQKWLSPPADAPKGWDLADGLAEHGAALWEMLRDQLGDPPRLAPPTLDLDRPKPLHKPSGNGTFAEIKDRIDIAEYIGRHSNTPLRRRGRAFLATCPGHEDKHPSLHVYPDTRSWYCYVCMTGGDVIDYERFRTGSQSVTL